MKKYLHFNILIFVCLTLVSITIVPVNASENMQKSSEKGKNDVPGKNRIGGATREICVSTDGQLIVFVPANNFRQTKSVTASPQFLSHIPQVSPAKYEKNRPAKISQGIINFSSHDAVSAPGLNVDSKYTWFLSMICKPNHRAH
ncbi:DUF928 domain-containing protein [Calothrix rhizosoleniae]|uniref:DUF928 domain-containing protein n=1 Tax=Calothrix rhizosoleniae TaxID=888997 RepID=UPI000B497F81|nr:DUF928 domain-containing protein [Calothrix rhizosoleniae]